MQAARDAHPDKGGDKQTFQDINNAYEKIMLQRKQSTKMDFEADDEPRSPKSKPTSKEKAEKNGDSDDKKGEEKKADDAEEKAEEEEEEEAKEDNNENLLEKMAKGAEEANKFASTAADFSHQSADAASTAQKTAANGSLPLVRSVVHSSIVLALTVVKAVRIVGYSALDVASAALQVSKPCPGSPCAAAAATAMSQGFEALQAASSAASATEQAAAKLQAEPQAKAGRSLRLAP